MNSVRFSPPPVGVPLQASPGLAPVARAGAGREGARGRRRAWTIAVSVLLHAAVIAALLFALPPKPEEDGTPAASYELMFDGGAPTTTTPGMPTPAEPAADPAPAAAPPAPAPPKEAPPGPESDPTEMPRPDAPVVPPTPPPAPPAPEPAPEPVPQPTPAPPTPAPPTPAPPTPAPPTPAPPTLAPPPVAPVEAPLGPPTPAPPAVVPEPAPLPPPARPPEVRLDQPPTETPTPPLVPDLVLPPPPPLPPPPAPPAPRPIPRPRASPPAAPPGTFANPMDLSFNSAPARPAAPRTTAPRGSVASRSLDLSPGVPRGPNKSDVFFDARAAKLGSDWRDGLMSYWLGHRYYPRQAAENGEDGSVDVELTVDGSGRVQSVVLKSHSGSPFIDMAAVGTWRNAKLMPLPPELGDRYTFTITLNYILIR